MSKRKNNEQLTAYLDGELSEAERRRVEQSLAGEPALAKELAELRAVRDMVRHLPREGAPAGFRDSVLDRLGRRALSTAPASAGRGVGRWMSLAVAAALLLALGAGFYAVMLMNSPHAWPVAQAPDRPAERGPVASGDSSTALKSDRPLAVLAPPAPPVAPPKAPEPPVLAVADVKMETAAPTIYIPVNTNDLAKAEGEARVALNLIQKPADAYASREKSKSASERAVQPQWAYNAAAGQGRFEVVVPESALPRAIEELEKVRARQSLSQDTPWANAPALAQVAANQAPDQWRLGSRQREGAQNSLYGELVEQAVRQQQGQIQVAQAPAAKATQSGAGAEEARRSRAAGKGAGAGHGPARGGPGRFDDEVTLAKGYAPGEDAGAGRPAGALKSTPAEGPRQIEQKASEKAADTEYKRPTPEATTAGTANQPAGDGLADRQQVKRLEEAKKNLPASRPTANRSSIVEWEEAMARDMSQQLDMKAWCAESRPASRPAAAQGLPGVAAGKAQSGPNAERLYNLCVILNDVNVRQARPASQTEMNAAPQPAGRDTQK